MLAKLEMVLEKDENELMTYQKAVLLQSILMSQISQDYAAILHESGLHPYRQSVEIRDGKNIWTVAVTNKEAYEQIIKPLECCEFQEFILTHDKCRVVVSDKKSEKIMRKQLTTEFYFEDASRHIDIDFVTPTAFKSQNQYIFYPDMRLIYQSLFNKYEASSSDETMNSPELLEQMTENTNIIQYNLRSCNYYIGKVKIPAFTGKIRLKIQGPQSLVNFANLLFHFGEYSGVGIKTAMGMGTMKVSERVRT